MIATDRAAALSNEEREHAKWYANLIIKLDRDGDLVEESRSALVLARALLAAEAERERLAHVNEALTAAHRKIAAVRVVVEGFWLNGKGRNKSSHRDRAWAAHVALVQLDAILRRSGGDNALIESLTKATTDTERHDG